MPSLSETAALLQCCPVLDPVPVLSLIGVVAPGWGPKPGDGRGAMPMKLILGGRR